MTPVAFQPILRKQIRQLQKLLKSVKIIQYYSIFFIRVPGDVQLEAPDAEGRGDSEDVKAVVVLEVEELGALQAQLQSSEKACSGTIPN